MKINKEMKVWFEDPNIKEKIESYCLTYNRIRRNTCIAWLLYNDVNEDNLDLLDFYCCSLYWNINSIRPKNTYDPEKMRQASKLEKWAEHREFKKSLNKITPEEIENVKPLSEWTDQELEELKQKVNAKTKD